MTPTTPTGRPADGFVTARRCAAMAPSAIREILKAAERPGVISLAGGLPAAETFPVEAVREACAQVLRDTPHAALQYAASEGFGPLRDWIAARCSDAGVPTSPDQVLVTTGSQQALDLVGKVLIDAGSTVAVESPTYLGALQAFAPYEPVLQVLDGDDDGPRPQALAAARGARFAYLVPSFQNPTGRCLGDARRRALAAAAVEAGVPLVEDDPYGELWCEAPPPAPIARHAPDVTVRLGSFSKVLAPGLRLGWLVAPPALFPALLQARQAADLHTSGFAQRLVHAVVTADGGRVFAQGTAAARALYRERRDAMLAALDRHLPPGCRWTRPAGGLFVWVEAPEGIDTAALLPAALDAGVAYVPGAAFHPAVGAVPRHRLRLSYATVAPAAIEAGVAAVGRLIAEAVAVRRSTTSAMGVPATA